MFYLSEKSNMILALQMIKKIVLYQLLVNKFGN